MNHLFQLTMVQMVFQHLPTFSSVLQHPSSISRHELERHWCFIEGWHVCACGCCSFFEADHFLSVCTLLVIVCFFSVCRRVKCWSDVCRQLLLQLLLGPSVVWLVCKRDIHDVITCNYCAWSHHLVEKVQEIGTQNQSCGFTQWLTMCPMESQ